MNIDTEEVKYPCDKCGKETVMCPMCGGSDPYVKDGQYDGFHLCQDKECDHYQYCCGC